MSDTTPVESVQQLRESFSYGSRHDYDFKFVKGLTDAQFGEFLTEMFAAVSAEHDDSGSALVAETVQHWQMKAYAGKYDDDPTPFPYRYDDVPIARLKRPLADTRIALITSSGHFVDGDDPAPLGLVGLTQRQSMKHIGEFLDAAPQLSSIPFDTPAENLRVRHPGYRVDSAEDDHQVNFPTGHVRALVDEGVIGDTLANAYSFVGAASQKRILDGVAREWTEQLLAEEVEAALFVPV